MWKTENTGTSWTPIFDNEGAFSIGCVTLDPSRPLTVWVGTGENKSQRSVAYGDGVYRSDDGGKSWKNMGLKASEHIGKILVHPKDSNIVFVAAQGPLWSAGGDRGLYKTTDGGKTWKAVLTVSEHTGATDVVMDPAQPGRAARRDAPAAPARVDARSTAVPSRPSTSRPTAARRGAR